MKKYQMQKYKVRFKRTARGARGLITNDEKCVSGLYVEAEFTYMQIKRFLGISSPIEVMLGKEYVNIIGLSMLDKALSEYYNRNTVESENKEEPEDGHIEKIIDEEKQHYKVYDAPRRRSVVTNSLGDPGEIGPRGAVEEVAEEPKPTDKIILSDKIEVEESVEMTTEISPDPDVESDVEEAVVDEQPKQQNKNNNYQQNNKYNNNKNKNNQYQQQRKK